jgi:hypothetical protein
MEDSCVGCNAGTHKALWGTTGCIKCDAPTYSQNASILCSACPRGKMWIRRGAEETACAICEAGKYAYNSGSTVCTDCPAGSYSNTFLAWSCTSCPASSWSAAGSTNLSNCSCIGYIFSGSTICIVEIATASLTHFLLAGATQDQMESLALPATLVNSRPFTDPRRA